ncbi:glycoside hydrolase family protein [Kocuria rosea]|uniref:glycosyl hydrolase family 28-related protein n=1 Tax=Kocuria rosea TaxID=1275 RepID=UPI001643D92C|nr:glycosyl hydrolase family 28-related protein [Kocuria rosea]
MANRIDLANKAEVDALRLELRNALNGFAVLPYRISDGPPTDAPEDGQLPTIDTTNSRLYIRTNGAWRYTELGDADLGLTAEQLAALASVPAKADQDVVDAALALKADQEAVTTALATKVNSSTYTAGLALKADQTAVDTALTLKADLIDGKVAPAQMPAIAISDVTTVDSEAEMLALTAQVGDVAKRPDLDGGPAFMLAAEPATTLENWVRIAGDFATADDVAAVALSQAQLDLIAEVPEKVDRAHVALNLRQFGAFGTGVADDSAAIKAAQDALTSGMTLFIPKGSYRFAATNASGTAALALTGLSNVGVIFEPGAEILMDNLNESGAGTTHGISVKGAGDNISIVNGRVRWNVPPNTRSQGEAFRFLGYPSDSAPVGGWTGSTGKLQNIQLINCTAIRAPQTGAIFMGCSDVRVVNFRVESTRADALHFNACRRVNVNGHTAIDSGDDGIAFVTYYDPSALYSSQNGPFRQPSLGEWSNTNSQATGIVVKGGTANGLRLSGALNVTVTNLNVNGKGDSGFAIDSAVANGSTFNWTYLASRGVSINNVTVDNTPIGFKVVSQNVNSSSDDAYWRFGVRIDGVTVRNATNWSARTNGDGSALSVVAGIQVNNLRVSAGALGNGVGFSALRDSSIENVWMESTNNRPLQILGQDAAGTTLVGMPRHNLLVDNIHNEGGSITFQDINGLSVGRIRSRHAGASGTSFIRVKNAEVDGIRVSTPNRLNTGTTRGLHLQKVASLHIAEVFLDHDANNATTWRSLEIGGGDAGDVAADELRIEKFVYSNTLNQAGSDMTVQGGSYAPKNYYVRHQVLNGGEVTPAWRFGTLGTFAPVQGGGVATVARPSAALCGAGTQIFDTTLNKPIWSTGAAWVDATGATV